MYFDFNVTGPERKRLVQAISSYTGTDARYLGAPTFAYQVDRFNIGKSGVVSVEGEIGQEELAGLMETLAEQGFVSQVSDCGSAEDAAAVPEEAAEGAMEAADAATDAQHAKELPGVVSQPPEPPEPPQEAAVGEICGFCVALRREGVTDAALENLRRLVDSKAALIRKALGADRVEIAVTDERISFPWFDQAPDAEMAAAAEKFIGRLLDVARTQKRVTAKEKPVDNEKFAFRCFLLKLGFIGPDFKSDRKTLLRNLTGSSAFKSGVPRE